jgi:hypothetical protein
MSEASSLQRNIQTDLSLLRSVLTSYRDEINKRTRSIIKFSRFVYRRILFVEA